MEWELLAALLTFRFSASNSHGAWPVDDSASAPMRKKAITGVIVIVGLFSGLLIRDMLENHLLV
jgi:hypothetical protein